ncbi:MAG: hypothetical protein ACYC8T_07215 [Myxococcaceae bacterium]
MKFPFVVIPECSPRQLERFHKHVDSDASGWHRKWTESIWRRHQHPSNAHLSGWRSEADRKRRLLHFFDEYGVVGRSFVLKNAYLWLCATLPAEHIDEYLSAIDEGLRGGQWERAGTESSRGLDYAVWRRGDLLAKIARAKVHPQDARRGYSTSPGSESIDVKLVTAGYQLPAGWDERPWRVFFDVGLREKLPRAPPRIVEPEALAALLPAQLELGCGPSIEAGIPHLSNLHRIYGVSLASYGFIFRAAADGLLQVFADPEAKYREMTDIYRAALVAEPTPFYRALCSLWHRGALVGPVITNNFDCQCADLGLPEVSLRRYDSGPYYPTIDYDGRAKSLLVVGVHADRRLVQMRARQRGLRVMYIDPEQYVAPDGSRIHYPVEAPQAEDLFARTTANEGMTRLHRAVTGEAPPER